MQTMKKELIRVGQKVDEVWMDIGQYLVRSWSAFKAKEVGQNLDESWMDFGRQKLLHFFSNTSPEIDQQRLHQSYTNPTPEFKRFSLKKVSQQLLNDYPEKEGFSLKASGQNQDEIGTENCVNTSSKFRQFEGYQVGQFLGETWVVLGPFYLEMNLVIQPPSFIAHSFIVHNKRVSYGHTKVTLALHQKFSLFDIPKLFLYVVLPDQNL